MPLGTGQVGLLTNFTYKNLSLVAVFDVKVGADLYSMSARAAYESGKSPETLAGRDAWYRSEEERLAAGIAKGADNWKPTGGFVAPGVIDNGDGDISSQRHLHQSGRLLDERLP